MTNSFKDWTGFLAMAGRLYKYPFDQQLMVYVQRPEALACAEADLWERRMRRHIRNGSKAIVIVDNSGKMPVLRYIFDVSDTEGAEATHPKLWERHEKCHDAVAAALEKRLGRSGEDDMAAKLDEISERLAQEFWNDHREDILDAVPGSFLEEYDEFNVEASFCRAASVSMAYAMMSRCNLEPDEYFQHDDFLKDKSVTKERLLAWKAEIGAKNAASTVNVMISAVNSFFAFMSWDNLRVKQVKTQRRIYRDKDRELTKAEYMRPLNAARNNGNLRLYYLMQTLGSTGIRVSELPFITIEALRTGSAVVDCKGKQRTVLIPKKLRKILLSYCEASGIASGPVFVTRRGNPVNRSNILMEQTGGGVPLGQALADANRPASPRLDDKPDARRGDGVPVVLTARLDCATSRCKRRYYPKVDCFLTISRISKRFFLTARDRL